MPLYEYLSEDPDDPDRSCIVCRTPFELRRPLSRGECLSCPTCGRPVRKLPSLAAVGAETLTDEKVKRAGFTVLKNAGDGVIEKI